MERDQDLVTVFEAMEPGLVALVHSILQGADIQFTPKGEAVQDFLGLGRLVEFQVRREDVDAARSLLREFLAPDAGAV
jgi:hypothetical protein